MAKSVDNNKNKSSIFVSESVEIEALILKNKKQKQKQKQNNLYNKEILFRRLPFTLFRGLACCLNI